MNQEPFPSKINWIVIATGFGFALVQLDVTIVNVALPRIGTAFAAPVAFLQWVVDAYTVTFSALLLAAGSVGDRFGAKRVYLAGMTLFTAASLACGFAGDVYWLVGARAIQGIGAALMLPNSLTLLSHACDADDRLRSRAVGRWTAMGGFAIAAGPIAGALLLQALGWRSIFFVNLPLCALGAWGGVQTLEETARPEKARPLDWGGQAFAVVALAALSFAVIEIRPLGPSHPLVIGAAVLAVGAVWLLVRNERRVPSPVLPLEFFHRPGFTPALIFGVVVNLAYYGIVFVLSLYLQQQLHFSVLRAGLAYVPLTATFIAANITSGALTARIGARRPMTAGGVIASIGFGLLLFARPAAPYWALLPAFILIPAGIGLGVPAMTATLLSAVEKSFSGVASAVLNAGRQAAGAVGVALFGAFVAANNQDISVGVRWSALVSAGAMLTGGLIAARYIDRRRADQPRPATSRNESAPPTRLTGRV